MMSAFNLKILVLLNGAAVGASLVAAFAIFFAEWMPFLLVAFAIAYQFFLHDGRNLVMQVILLFVSPLIAFTIAQTCKLLVPSPRPFADGLDIIPLISVSDPFGSFPSAHAAFFGALGTTIFLQNRGIGKWYLGAALMIGISRVATGVHFPSDVIAGLLLGVLVSIFQNLVHRFKINLQMRYKH